MVRMILKKKHSPRSKQCRRHNRCSAVLNVENALIKKEPNALCTKRTCLAWTKDEEYKLAWAWFDISRIRMLDFLHLHSRVFQGVLIRNLC
ncbi:hypothetical protein Hdeb2414_s0018g00529851 [Helianthus debilis subsp. tardiflorus]